MRLGSVSRESILEKNAHEINIANTIAHPDFRLNSYYNDIGLIKLLEPIQFSQYIRPACLPEADTLISNNLFVTGWGLTSYTGESHTNLQRVSQFLVAHDECNTIYNDINISNLKNGIIDESQICARNKAGERDACQVCKIKLKLNLHKKCLQFST